MLAGQKASWIPLSPAPLHQGYTYEPSHPTFTQVLGFELRSSYLYRNLFYPLIHLPRYLNCLLCSLRGMNCFIVLHIDIKFSRLQLLIKLTFLQCTLFDTIVKDQVNAAKYVYFWLPCYIPSVYVYVFVSLPQCFVIWLLQYNLMSNIVVHLALFFLTTLATWCLFVLL